MRTFDLTPQPRPSLGEPEGPELSLVAPAYNEEDNLEPLLERVRFALGDRLRWELVIVDDGSTDGSAALLERLGAAEPRLRTVRQPGNFGQTSALAAGLRSARAPFVATLDADMQNDPADLPAMLEVLGEHDAVCGYRAKRNDTVIRRWSSIVANAVRNRLTGEEVRDTGCGLKLFRTDAIRAIPLFEGMHRFFPTLLRWNGYSVVEVAVSHHERTRGISKYGVWNRVFRALRDLIAVRWMRSRLIRPLPADREREHAPVPRLAPESASAAGAERADAPAGEAAASNRE